MAYNRNSNLHRLAYALEKRADFLEDAKEWIADNPELAAGLLGGTLGAGGGALVPSEDGAGGRVRNALIGALLGGGVGAGAGYLGKDAIKDLLSGDGDKKMDPLNTVEGGIRAALAKTLANQDKYMHDLHPYVPANTQTIDWDVLPQPDSTTAALDDIMALRTSEDILEGISNSDAPIKYDPSNAADKANRELNRGLDTAERTHR